MERYYMGRLEQSRKAVKYWWLMLLLGIAVFVFGILIFVNPVGSYVAMAIAFGVLMLAAGVINIILAASTNHILVGRGWLLASGIIELILGLILVLNVKISAETLPFFLGFWLMLRSFTLIGAGSEMMSAKINGGGWTVALGVLLLFCSMMILVAPLWIGAAAVVIWVGVAFLMGGISLCMGSFQLKRLHKFFEKS